MNWLSPLSTQVIQRPLVWWTSRGSLYSFLWNTIPLSGLTTSLGSLTTSLIASPAFRTNVSVSGSQGTKKPCTILPSLMTLWQKRFRRTQSGDWQDYQPYLWVRWNMFYSVLPFKQAYVAGGWHSPSFGRNIDVFCLINLARTVKHGTVKLYLAAVCNLHSSCEP